MINVTIFNEFLHEQNQQDADVYKRQVIFSITSSVTSCIFVLSFHKSSNSFIYRSDIGAVSYTHLDVYKRQYSLLIPHS